MLQLKAAALFCVTCSAMLGVIYLGPPSAALGVAEQTSGTKARVRIKADIETCNRGDGQVNAHPRFSATAKGSNPSYIRVRLAVTGSGGAVVGSASRTLYRSDDFRAVVEEPLVLAANTTYGLLLKSKIKYVGLKAQRKTDRGTLSIAAPETYPAC